MLMEEDERAVSTGGRTSEGAVGRDRGRRGIKRRRWRRRWRKWRRRWRRWRREGGRKHSAVTCRTLHVAFKYFDAKTVAP